MLNGKPLGIPIAVLCGVLLSSGMSLEAQPLDQGWRSSGGHGCLIRVATPRQPGAQPVKRSRFSAAEILDLEFTVLFPSYLSGDHIVRLGVLTPSGHLYQELTVPFTSDLARAVSWRKVDRFPRPLEVQVAKPKTFAGRRAVAVTAVLPVGGTSIVHSSLYGKWRVAAELDGNRDIRCMSRPFLITE